MFTKEILCVFLVVALINPSFGSCPNKCSGHGSCSVNDVCSCQQNWINGDCSGRQCPFTRAWVDTAQYSNDAHYWAECGNKGICDRSTGICQCAPGYEGSGCRRTSCPNQCSGHGTCEFIEEMASDDADKRIGGTSSNTYTLWDQEKTTGCKCDPGFEGYDCSSRVCPKGDDPLTTSQSDMKQYIVLVGAGGSNMYLTYYDPYGNAWTTQDIDATGDITSTSDNEAVCTNIQTALRRLPNHALDDVTVTHDTGTFFAVTRTAGADVVTAGTCSCADQGDADNTAHRCIVTFPSSPGTTGLQHLLGCTVAAGAAGQQPYTAGGSSTCKIGEYSSTNVNALKLTELAECSNRGICDGTTGTCQCFAGHKGLACETQEALV